MNVPTHARTERRPLVVWRAGVPWDGVTGTDRHLVTHLARWVDVLWVDPATSVVHRVRQHSVRGLRPAHLRPRTTDVAPGVRRLDVTAGPFPLRPGVIRFTEALLRRATRRAVVGRPVAAVVGTTPYHRLDVVPGARTLYFATDDFRAGAALMGRDPAWMAAAEEQRLREADVAGAVSQAIVDAWSTSVARTFVLPNGCDTDHYAAIDDTAGDAAHGTADVLDPAARALPRPVVGAVGQFSPRTDLALLEAVADRGLSLLLVGPRIDGWGGGRFDALVARPNVVWVGAQPFEALPAYLRLVDLGITAYVDSAFNRASSPLKTIEYLAAGRRALSTPLPAVAELGTDLVACASGAEAFADAAVALTSTPLAEEERAVRRAFATQHSWQARARTLLGELGLEDAEELRPASR